MGPFNAMHVRKWKIIYFYDRERWELYDLSADVGERNDLAQRHPERLRELARTFAQRLEEMGAQYPTVSATGKQVGVRLPN